MNTHIPQNLETAYELQALTSVPTQIISPATSVPIIQVKEDTLTAAYLFTLPHVTLSKKEVFNLLMTNESFTGILPPAVNGKWNGRDMFSMFLPDISFKKNNNNYDIDPSPHNTVIVENGNFKQGTLDKAILGKTLIHMIYDSFGSKAVKDFLDNNQRLLNRWLASKGFTISMGDCIPTREDVDKIKEFVDSKIKDINSLIMEANMGTYKQNLDNKFIKLSLEADIQEQLNGAKFNFEKYIRKNINEENAIYVTMTAGSKGTISNVSQIRGMVGQTSVAGNRISFGYERRTLPLFSKDDYGARSRGFIANCFFNGLDPVDYFFHQMGGREGVIDTAIKSVSADTAIIILENNEAKYVKIGDWIDEMMDKRKSEVEHKEQLEQELLNLNVPTYIPTTDDEGNVSWGNVVAVTRHDPGQGMFKITTSSGRDVKVVESKSLIVWDNELEKFKEVNTSDVVVGNFLPVMHKLAEFEDIIIENNDEMRVINNAINGKFTVLNGEDSYRRWNDVVLDPIVSIERLNVEDYPKVYDITVPSTLNFGLANGLMVRDTAESGYMQRRLIKALEDLSVKYGGTIRNGINNVVQFAYGDDGIDPCKLNKQELKLVEYSNEEMEKRYLITEDDFGTLKTLMTPAAYKETMEFKDKFRGEFERLIDMRDKARSFYFRNMNIMNATVFSPVFFPRTIKNAKDLFTQNKKTDLTPQYMKKCFDELEGELLKYLPEFSLNIFRALLYSNLSVKECILVNKFNKTIFKYIVDTIREKQITSLVQPGEMVGVIGAQSMGEPLTQMSVPSDTKVIVKMNGEMKKMDIGVLIDGLINSLKGKIVRDKEGKHTIMKINDDIRIMSVSKGEKTSWKKISKVSRHPVNGQLMKVTTRSGRSTRATLSHSFLKRVEDGIEPVLGSDLNIGDRIPSAMNIPTVEEVQTILEVDGDRIELTEEFGYLCGAFVSMGTANKAGIKLNKKFNMPFIDNIVERLCDKNGWIAQINDNTILIKSGRLGDLFMKEFVPFPDWVYGASIEFIRGLLGALVDFDGIVDGKKMNLRFCSKNRVMLGEMAILFGYIGVFVVLGDENRTNSVMSTLSISRKYAKTLSDNLNLNVIDKRLSLSDIVSYLNRSDAHDVAEYVDKIPAVGGLIAEIGKILRMPQHSRVYGRWKNKESIGRRTLGKYLDAFNLKAGVDAAPDVKRKLDLIEQAYRSDVVWDEVINIEVYDGEDDEYVYDFTVPGTESFMVDDGILVHNTLNTFHNAGVGASGVVTSTGVPRIKEIINVAKTIKTPAMEIYLKPEHTEDINKAKVIGNQIEFTKLQDIVEKTMIIYDNPGQQTEYDEDLEFVQVYQEFAEIIGISQCPQDQLSRWVLRVVFSKEKMMNKNIYLADIQNVIQRNSVEDDISCTFSDDNAKELMMRIIIKNDGYDVDNLSFLQELEKVLMSITIRGIPNVEKAVPQMMKRLTYREDGSYNQTTEWFLATIGVNLLDVLMNENVDETRTLSNDIHEINEIFGIEATRNIILRELLKMDDYNVNYRHISLLGDIMTHRGAIMTIERHGINRSAERGPIAKATFEESTEILVKASTFGEKDKMGGVSANIMFGQLPKVGTNAFELLLDESKFIMGLKNKKKEEVIKKDMGEIIENVEQTLGEEYKENAGELIDNAFEFSVDPTKNPEEQLTPHLMPEKSVLKKGTRTKKKK